MTSNHTIEDLFNTLVESNKYHINISSTKHCMWNINIFNNGGITVDIQEPNALTSHNIDVSQIIEYISGEDEVKIKYACYYDDFKTYHKVMVYILNEIQQYYLGKKKNIVIRYKLHYT